MGNSISISLAERIVPGLLSIANIQRPKAVKDLDVWGTAAKQWHRRHKKAVMRLINCEP